MQSVRLPVNHRVQYENPEEAESAAAAQRLDGICFVFRVASAAWLTRDLSATTMSAHLSYRDVDTFMRTHSSEAPPYDFNGVLHLVLSGVENLRTHAIDQDFIDFACSISDEQAVFLRRLLDTRPQSIADLEPKKCRPTKSL